MVLLVACSTAPVAAPASSAPEAPSTTGAAGGSAVPIESTGADTLRDLIRPGDPSAEFCLVDLGVAPGEFYLKETDELVFPEATHFFEARYDDGTRIEIRLHPALVDAGPETLANRIAGPVALLPTELRRGIERVGMAPGASTAQGDGGGEGIMVYEENVGVREASMRFEETIFHESVHTSLDDLHVGEAGWIDAQAADGAFLTAYAAGNPEREDLAETALYAWALKHHPDRISEADEAAWRALVPARLAYIDSILSPPNGGYSPTSPDCST